MFLWAHRVGMLARCGCKVIASIVQDNRGKLGKFGMIIVSLLWSSVVVCWAGAVWQSAQVLLSLIRGIFNGIRDPQLWLALKEDCQEDVRCLGA